jgi:DMSO/TMAO reductase YedYZ molybdopterin-dependent catalytic subunit
MQSGAAAASLAAFAGLDRAFERAFSALQQPGDAVIPWTDIPANFVARGNLDTRTFDRSKFITPNEEFYLVQHYGTPTVDAANYSLKLTGMFEKPLTLTLDDLKRRPRFEQVVGWECGGSSPASLNRLTGNAKWTGTRLRDLLRVARMDWNAREVVFFGIDKGKEKVTHGRSGELEVEQHFGRSLHPEDANRPEVMLAWEMNGQPLSPIHGFPVRLVVPGWYGVANVKWLDRIHAQDTRYIGRFMSRDYVTFKPEQVGDETIWNEALVARMRVKSMIAKLTRNGTRYTAHGFALGGNFPMRMVEVKVDDGPWQRATFDSQNTEFSWKLFSYSWDGLTPGQHTIVSRATDGQGIVQPEQSAVDPKKTQWENNGQFVRKFTV